MTHEEEHHKFYLCPCGTYLWICAEDATHSVLDSAHRWEPVLNPMGSGYNLILNCWKVTR